MHQLRRAGGLSGSVQRRWVMVGFAAVGLFIAAPALAQQTGPGLLVVVSDSAGRPLSEATVSIDGRSETARTDSAGRATLHVPAGEFTVRVRRVGYSEAARSATVADAERQEIGIVLRSVQVLPAVRVAARAPLPAAIERRREWGRGTFIGPEELAKAHTVRELVARARGARIDGAGGDWLIKFHNPKAYFGTARRNTAPECWADVYIDGRLSAPYISSTVSTRGAARVKFEELTTYSPSAIYTIEVYERASQAPSSIVGVRDGCGVILVWTRAWAEAELRAEERRHRAEADRHKP